MKKAIKQLKALEKLTKDNKLRLAAEWNKNWKILISTILSAQTKDELTIDISNKLYKKYKTSKSLAEAKLSDIQKIIRPINYYRTKARHIKRTAQIINKKGIPKHLDGLLKLPGVGRKVGNVYLAVAHKTNCIGVDTHVGRISIKLGWSKNSNPHKVEKDLEKLFPKRYWRSINYILVRFGRIHGKSRKKEDEILKRVKNIR
ncbi:endonuclease III domain-containing protein [Nanoarchaeota archaeon]